MFQIGQTKLKSAKKSARTSLSHAPAEAAPRQDGSLTAKASSFNERLLTKCTRASTRTETERLAQRGAALPAISAEPSEGGYREMAVDVPDYVLEMDAKKKVGLRDGPTIRMR